MELDINMLKANYEHQSKQIDKVKRRQREERDNLNEINESIEIIENNQTDQTEQRNRMTYLEFLLQYPNMMTNQLKQSMRESILTRENIYQIRQWTMKEVGNKLFDSLIDNWDINTSEFNDLIDGKQHLLIVIEDTNENKFGVY